MDAVFDEMRTTSKKEGEGTAKKSGLLLHGLHN